MKRNKILLITIATCCAILALILFMPNVENEIRYEKEKENILKCDQLLPLIYLTVKNEYWNSNSAYKNDKLSDDLIRKMKNIEAPDLDSLVAIGKFEGNKSLYTRKFFMFITYLLLSDTKEKDYINILEKMNWNKHDILWENFFSSLIITSSALFNSPKDYSKLIRLILHVANYFDQETLTMSSCLALEVLLEKSNFFAEENMNNAELFKKKFRKSPAGSIQPIE